MLLSSSCCFSSLLQFGLLLEHGWDQAAAVRELLVQQGWEQVQSRQDLSGTERCSGARRPSA